MCPDKGEVGVGVEDFVWHCLVHNRVASAVHVTVSPKVMFYFYKSSLINSSLTYIAYSL